MSKAGIDYLELENKLYKKAYRLDDVKDKLESVAFDIVKFKDEDRGASLWQIHKGNDGEYIVAMYQPEDDQVVSAWDVSVNKVAGNIQISYKGDPIAVVSSAKLGIPKEELEQVRAYLPEKLAESKKLVRSLLGDIPSVHRAQILKKYPELV